MLKRVYALHGFLGSPLDWECFTPENLGVDLLTPIDLQRPTFEDPGAILMGYSLGGRMALHFLLDRPTFWKAAIIISAHPGLTSLEERQTRLAKDRKWAKRFAEEPWESVLNAWNSQPIFRGSRQLPRKPTDYYCQHLESWSLGKQEDLRESISTLPPPILWLFGQRDETHAAIAPSLRFAHPHSRIACIPDSGHRVPWDQPETFQSTVKEWLCGLNN